MRKVKCGHDDCEVVCCEFCGEVKMFFTTVRKDLRKIEICYRPYTDTSSGSGRYRKKKTTEFDRMPRELDQTRMWCHMITSERDRLLVENANLQCRVAGTMYTNELLKSKVGRHTGLGIVVLELTQERIGKTVVEQENTFLKVAVPSHVQATLHLQEEVNR